MRFEIKNRWTDEVLFAADTETLKEAVEQAVRQGASLDGARLDGARLDGARLDGASLDGASLDGARLDGASLDGASLVRARLDGARLFRARLFRARLDGARLDGARLDGARLDGASLDGASLDGARLDGARLDGASLDGASLDGARLDGARLTPIRDDIWAVLSAAPREVEGLRQALIDGRVEGSSYTGECACLVGTIANVRGESYEKLGALRPQGDRPAERFFLAIRKGDKPETSQFSRLALQWVDEWLASMRAAFSATA